MLRRAYDHHRDFRTWVSAQSATISAKPIREDAFVTRHEPNPIGAAAAALRPTAHCMPDAVNDDPMRALAIQRSTRSQRRSDQCRNKTARQTRLRLAKSISASGQKSNLP